MSKKTEKTFPMIDTAEPGRAEAKAYYRIFQGNKDGRQILANMAQQFYDRMSYQPGDDAMIAAYREGQRSVILHIITMCQRAQEQEK